MKMFLTRLGENANMVVTGDLSQVDLPHGTRSGLRDATEILDGMEGISVVHFDDGDVVRHPLVTQIVRAYDAFEKKTEAGREYMKTPSPGPDSAPRRKSKGKRT
jgi:phosphate starvation-inducible PhoH-like protein